MINIVGIGANVCDTLLTIPNFPAEDTKMKASSAVQSGGGPCATGLVAASKPGESCAFIGNLSDDSAGSFLKADMEKYEVSENMGASYWLPDGVHPAPVGHEFIKREWIKAFKML